MKKIISLLVISIIFLTGFNSVSLAQSSETKSVFNREKSIEESYEDAINGISDLQENSIGLSSVNINSKTNDTSSSVKQYSTTQILSETVKEDSVEQKIAVTVFNNVALKQQSNDNIRTMDDKGRSEWDSSLGVRAHSRIYYTISKKDNVRYAKLNKITGGWKIDDSSIKLSKRTVRYGSSGWPSGTQKATKNPSGNSYSYNAPSSWKKTAIEGGRAVGSTSVVTLKRGGSTWTLTLVNNL
ncbi:hypothetical protein BA81_19139 [Bacillus safensis FO-36b]|uniref:hypothetical protein n=2 Tax=Bacillaceae TaxID=186817 RepID=UPI00045C5728|nr:MULTISPECIES: hypothetical protein [Bacillus]KDE25550.1 hypothetical protein BA81_19139 [Bacillus safensis FO-36b]MEC1042179.1 hypothetical protein [Bacillus altitudinis]MEC1091450.1 hypothetical protein [Bacillus altitudinis]